MKDIKAYIATVSTFFIWSTVGLVVNKTALTPYQLLCFGSLVAFIAALIILVIRNKGEGFKKLRINRFLLLLFFSQGIFGLVWFKALTLLHIGIATFIFSLFPVLIFLLAPYLIQEKTLLSIFSLGALFGLASALTGALTGIATRKIASTYSLSFIVAVDMLAQVVFSLPFIFFASIHFHAQDIFYIFYQGIIGSVIPFYLFIIGFRSLKATVVQTIGYFEPFLASLWGVLFLSQSVSWTFFVGGICIVLSNYFLIKNKPN